MDQTTAGTTSRMIPASAAVRGANVDAGCLDAFLLGRDVPCPRCEYNLRDLTGGRCPECGDLLVLRIGSAEPRMGAYLAVVAAACLGFGGSLMFGAVAAAYAGAGWWGKRAGLLLVANAVVDGTLLAAALLGRRRFRMASPSAQRRIVALAWGVVAVLATLFVALFNE